MLQSIVQVAVVIVAAVIVLIVIAGLLSFFSESVRAYLLRRVLRPLYRALREEAVAEVTKQQDRTSRQAEIREAVKNLTGGILGFAPGDGYFHKEQKYRFEHAAAVLRLECPDASEEIDALLDFTGEQQWHGTDSKPRLRAFLKAVTDKVSKELRDT